MLRRCMPAAAAAVPPAGAVAHSAIQSLHSPPVTWAKEKGRACFSRKGRWPRPASTIRRLSRSA